MRLNSFIVFILSIALIISIAYAISMNEIVQRTSNITVITDNVFNGTSPSDLKK